MRTSCSFCRIALEEMGSKNNSAISIFSSGLSGYRKYYVNSKHSEKLIEAHSAEEYKEKVFIKFSDIKRIEKLERKRAEKDIYSC